MTLRLTKHITVATSLLVITRADNLTFESDIFLHRNVDDLSLRVICRHGLLDVDESLPKSNFDFDLILF